MATDHTSEPEDQQHPLPPGDGERNTALRALDGVWHVAEPRVRGGLLGLLRHFLIQQLVRPFVVPLLEAQNAYNAAATKALHALAESSDRRRSHLEAQAAARETALDHRLEELEQRILDLDDADTTLAELLLLRSEEPAAAEEPRG